MPLGISEDHLALHDTARRFLEAHCPPSVPRACFDAAPGQPSAGLPPFWGELARLGWLGLHLPEDYGGEGYGLPELSVVLEEMGRAMAPGPFLPTVLASYLVHRLGSDELRAELLPGLADGSRTAAVAFASPALEGDSSDGRARGVVDAVLGADQASYVLVSGPAGPERFWVIDPADPAVRITPLPSLDSTRRMARVELDGVEVPERWRLGPVPGRMFVHHLAVAFFAAEAVGVADWCVDTAASYAKVREQFGRPIGQFQGVKHRCADMLMRLEHARAAAWDVARALDGDSQEAALAVAVAGSLAPEAAFQCAKDCIQVLGGIGFTWEHDAHLYLKRATAVRQVVEAPWFWQDEAADLAREGVRRTLAVDLPPKAEEFREEVRAFLAGLKEHDKSEWRRIMADAGYAAAHYPEPWGLGATPVRQLVIDDEFRAARVRIPHLQVGAWVLPTLVAHGSAEQRERFIPPTLRGELTWCQLFSEPGAGSDLAGLSTKASAVDGGWVLTGQKVWTTFAHETDYGLCLARTDPSVPKHEGITCFVVDMKAEGIDIRPLRELTGAEMFNEVFLEDVFVPDDCVVGNVNDGWRVGRTTLENERVSMGSGSSFGFGVEGVLRLLDGLTDPDPALQRQVGALVAEAQALAVMGFRMTVRSVTGMEPGPESSLRKLLGVEHDQLVQEVGLTMLGDAAAVNDGDAAMWIGGFLANRCLTIAGGTSEVQRNVIAERLLGLPKDP